ncbi:Regulation of nuclear pre-mRNA domain-containing protein 1B [Halotydeus destructor]|nr:Regulation of nuclear pre-mRNA domain-containing protein 1B [Halotydeus destructor]
MAGFTTEALSKKLQELNPSQQSIQTLSLWLIHHRKHNKVVVQTWATEVRKAKGNKKLTLMYLANDIIQNSKKKGPEYIKEFSGSLKGSFENIAKDCDDKTWSGLNRILNVWEERGVYDKALIADWKKGTGTRKVANDPKVFAKPSKSDRTTGKSKGQEKADLAAKRRKMTQNLSKPVPTPRVTLPPLPAPTEGVIVESNKLVQALKNLENSASTDSTAREKIASFPPEISDPSLLSQIQDKDAADKLRQQIDAAWTVISEYNRRLVHELEERKQVSVLLATYVKNQTDLLSSSEKELKEYKEKLTRICQVKMELKLHLQNLPDLSLLPSVTGGLAPLPSVGDLFNAPPARNEHRYMSSMASTSSASPNSASPMTDYEPGATPNTPNS